MKTNNRRGWGKKEPESLAALRCRIRPVTPSLPFRILEENECLLKPLFLGFQLLGAESVPH